ncbi:hypothetical protein [Shewanella woodyi]|uniref:hypothetical protein n=1 Tax=Shewanella woodyi TaxID=60961 RepID=UPI003749AD48
MDELSILVDRLGWPNTSTRWWVILELAARLGEPTAKVNTESVLLELLRSRKLEAEVVEILCIFWIAVQGDGYSPDTSLSENIPRPSPLSDLLLENIGLPIQASNSGLKEVPECFEIPDDFDGVQGADLPRVFHTTMSNLEALTQLPFLRQMAFEWVENQAAYPDVPYQGDPWYFTHSLGDDFIGQYSARAAIRAISAYLRTLAVAKELWGMPLQLVSEKALLAMPVHPSLAFLRPKRPSWFPEMTDFDGDEESIDSSLRALLARVDLTCPSDELIAFHSPIVMSMERCVEVSMVRWAQGAGSSIDDVKLPVYLGAFWRQGSTFSSAYVEPLSTTTILAMPTFRKLMDDNCKAWPLAGPLDFKRIGYLQHDLYPSRLFLPTLPDLDEAEITPRDGCLEVKVGTQTVAELSYWNAGWGSARPRYLGGNCGTAVISNGKAYRETVSIENLSLREFYLWQVRTLSRSGSNEKFSESLVTGVLFI